jgi:molybdopterin molybdotransferase
MNTPTAAPAAPARAGSISLEEALDRLVAAVTPFPAQTAESLPTAQAPGRVLAAEILSLVDVPPGDNTSMDGYAMRAADVPVAGTVLPISQRVAAGTAPQVLVPGTAARIFTGAQVPAGADAVVMQEQCVSVDADGSTRVRVDTVPNAGQWIRRRGEDVRAGAVVLAAGTRLTPQALGLAASVGVARVSVAPRPRVALLSTGDELVMPGDCPPDQMRPGTIYNSNRFTLRALLQSAGCDCSDLGIVPDRLDATRDALCAAALDNDLILTSGGVSVGEEDHIRPAVASLGRVDLWQMATKPGRPLAFGVVHRGGVGADGQPLDAKRGSAWFIGLPGNPVSSFVTFLLVVRPVLLRLQGATSLAPRSVSLRADFDWLRPDKRREFLRARINDRGGLDLYPNQSSGVLTSAVWGDGLIDNPAEQPIREGDVVRFLPFSELM